MKRFIIHNCPKFIDFDEQSLFENLCGNDGPCIENYCVLKEIYENKNIGLLDVSVEGE